MTFEGFFSGMFSNMSCQFICSWKCPSTQFTSKWPFTCVRSDVSFQMWTFDISFRATYKGNCNFIIWLLFIMLKIFLGIIGTFNHTFIWTYMVSLDCDGFVWGSFKSTFFVFSSLWSNSKVWGKKSAHVFVCITRIMLGLDKNQSNQQKVHILRIPNW